MVRITFVQQDGARHEIEAEVGESLMANAKACGVDGIIAECGGSLVCGTCHVYLEEAAFALVGAPKNFEVDLLENAREPRATSRLACQITVSAEMDGMEFSVPGSQH